MPTEDKMTIGERLKYLRIQHPHYQKANRQARSRLLEEMERVTGLDRKTIIRHMGRKRSDLVRKHRRKQRGRTYGHEVDDALRVILDSFGYLCAERLTPNLVWMANQLARHGEMTVSDALLDQLASVSVSTVHPILKRTGQDVPRLPRKAPRPANSTTRDVPMRRIPWDEPQPGHFEVDLVHHGGPSASGEHAYSLQMIDVTTGWSERVALLGRGYAAMEGAFLTVLGRVPFRVLEFHPNNGSEFFNAHLRRFWGQTAAHIQLSRSRPYHKNDNRFVEQKNKTLVCHYLGYERFDSVAHVHAIGALKHLATSARAGLGPPSNCGVGRSDQVFNILDRAVKGAFLLQFQTGCGGGPDEGVARGRRESPAQVRAGAGVAAAASAPYRRCDEGRFVQLTVGMQNDAAAVGDEDFLRPPGSQDAGGFPWVALSGEPFGFHRVGFEDIYKGEDLLFAGPLVVHKGAVVVYADVPLHVQRNLAAPLFQGLDDLYGHFAAHGRADVEHARLHVAHILGPERAGRTGRVDGAVIQIGVGIDQAEACGLGREDRDDRYAQGQQRGIGFLVLLGQARDHGDSQAHPRRHACPEEVCAAVLCVLAVWVHDGVFGVVANECDVKPRVGQCAYLLGDVMVYIRAVIIARRRAWLAPATSPVRRMCTTGLLALRRVCSSPRACASFRTENV